MKPADFRDAPRMGWELLQLLGMAKRTTDTNGETFGRRLARLRKAKGYSQAELGEAIGISQRMVAYYEGQTDRPPAQLLLPIARTLRISLDELLGLRDAKDAPAPKNTRLLRKLRLVEELPRKDQKHVLDMIDALLTRQRVAHKQA